VNPSIRLLDIATGLWYLDIKIPRGGAGMKAMTLRLDDTEYERLRTLAYVEKRSVTEVVREAVEDYIRTKAEHAEFRAALQRAMEENAQLIADLAKH